MSRGIHALNVRGVVATLHVERVVLRGSAESLGRVLAAAAIIRRELLQCFVAARKREDRRARRRGHAAVERE
jgi:hypothetical protein